MRNIPDYQKTAVIFLGVVALSLTVSSAVFAKATQDERAQLVDKELSCISKVKSRQGAFTWNDVCYLEEESKAPGKPKSVSVTVDAEGGVTLEKQGAQKAVPPKKAVKAQPQKDVKAVDLTVQDFDVEEDMAFGADRLARDDDYDIAGTPINRDRKKLNFEFGTENFYYDFDSDDGNSRVGTLFGVFGALTYHPGPTEDLSKYDNITMAKLDTHLAQDVDVFMCDIRALGGVDFISRSSTRLTPYLGLGYRYLRDKEGGSTKVIDEAFGGLTYYNGASYIKEEIKYIYIPVGVELHRPIRNRWAVQMNAEFDFILQGRSTRHYNQLGAVLVDANTGDLHIPNTMEFTHDKGYGWRASVKFLHSGAEMDFFVEPFIRFWKLDDSDVEQFRSDGTGVIWYYIDTNDAVTDQVRGHEITEYGFKAGVLY
jgi:hypothetical protein